MKALTLVLIIFTCCFIPCSLSAQTPQSIKKDFDALFDKLGSINASSDTSGNMYEALYGISDTIVTKLKYYTEKSPAAMSGAFKDIGISSEDGLFRIVSWDTNTGGTQHYFENVIQYNSGGKFVSIVDTNTDNHYAYAYDKIYTLKAKGKTFYLATYYGIFDFNDFGAGIRIFSIENGKLNDQTKLIKTTQHITYKLYFTYHITDSDPEPGLKGFLYDPNAKTITFPLINEDGHDTGDIITYKFTGQYFEKLKINK